MSRSGYTDYEPDSLEEILASGRYRGQVARATRGKRGQKMLCDLKAALEAMPNKRLVRGELEKDGEVCALGALGQARGLDMSDVDSEDSEHVASLFDIADPLAREVVFMNDDCWGGTSEQRWTYMHTWVSRQIRDGDTDK